MKAIGTLIIAFILICNFAVAQDTLYVFKAGAVLYKQLVSNIDSIAFSNKISTQETVTDIDGNVYHTIKIGTQTWMVENLKTTRYRYGGSIPNVTNWNSWANLSTGAYCNFNNLETNGIKYGRLYNWHAVNDSPIAPIGWHVPTDIEWNTLIDYLISNGGNYDGTTTGNKIGKSLAAKTDWTSHTGAGTVGNDLTTNNKSGFNGLPASFQYYYGSFPQFIGLWGEWWSADADPYYTFLHAHSYKLNYSSSSFTFGGQDKSAGLSVRCIKDK